MYPITRYWTETCPWCSRNSNNLLEKDSLPIERDGSSQDKVSWISPVQNGLHHKVHAFWVICVLCGFGAQVPPHALFSTGSSAHNSVHCTLNSMLKIHPGMCVVVYNEPHILIMNSGVGLCEGQGPPPGFPGLSWMTSFSQPSLLAPLDFHSPPYSSASDLPMSKILKPFLEQFCQQMNQNQANKNSTCISKW